MTYVENSLNARLLRDQDMRVALLNYFYKKGWLSESIVGAEAQYGQSFRRADLVL